MMIPYGAMISCKIPVVNIHHTPLIVTITNSITSEPIADVEGTLSNSKLHPFSNPKGIMNYETVSAGSIVSTFTHPKFISKSVDIHIVSGSTNTLTLTMTPIPTPPTIE